MAASPAYYLQNSSPTNRRTSASGGRSPIWEAKRAEGSPTGTFALGPDMPLEYMAYRDASTHAARTVRVKPGGYGTKHICADCPQCKHHHGDGVIYDEDFDTSSTSMSSYDLEYRRIESNSDSSDRDDSLSSFEGSSLDSAVIAASTNIWTYFSPINGRGADTIFIKPDPPKAPTPPPMNIEETIEEHGLSDHLSEHTPSINNSSHHSSEQHSEHEPSVHEETPPPPPPEIIEPVMIPIYRRMCEREDIPFEVLTEYLYPKGRETGGFVVMRPGTNNVVQFHALMTLSGKRPVFKVKNMQNRKARLFYLCLNTAPSRNPKSIDVFKDYVFPAGVTIPKLKKSHFVMVASSNARDPLIFCFESDAEAERFYRVIRSVQQAGRYVRAQQDEVLIREKELMNAGWVSLPNGQMTRPSNSPKKSTTVAAPSSEHEELSREFEKDLIVASQRLSSQAAVSKFWKREMEMWTTYWNPKKGKYVTQKLFVFIHPYLPYLCVCDKKGNILTGSLEMMSYTASHIAMGGDGKKNALPKQLTNRTKCPYIAAFDVMDPVGKKVIFSLETRERHRDLMQTCAVLAHMQNEIVRNKMEDRRWLH